jgi:hypothetical protein
MLLPFSPVPTARFYTNSFTTTHKNLIAGIIPQSLRLQKHVKLASLCCGVTSQENARSRVRVHQCVSAVRAVGVPVFVRLRRSCSHVTEVGGP